MQRAGKIRRRELLAGAMGLAALGLVDAPPAQAVAAADSQYGFGAGDTIQPFNQSFWGQRLINPAQDSTAAGLQVGPEIAAQAKIAPPTLNIAGDYSAEKYIVPATLARVPVKSATGGYHLQAELALGVPIPQDFVPATSGEPTLCIYQPFYVSKYGRIGNYWELYKVAGSFAAGWSCETGCRYTGVNLDTKGASYVWVGGPGAAAYATDPDSTYTDAPFTTGSGLPYWSSVVGLAEVRRGFIDHVVGLELVHSFGHVAPATRSDGVTTSSVIHEGDRLFLSPADVVTGVHPLNALLQQAAVNYGFVVNDMSGAVAVRFAPSVGAAGYLGSTPRYGVLNGFPFGKLKRLA